MKERRQQDILLPAFFCSYMIHKAKTFDKIMLPLHKFLYSGEHSSNRWPPERGQIDLI